MKENRTDLWYPKIPHAYENCPINQCIAFEKYDGTNFHFEWNFELGFHSFGTRRDCFNLDAGGKQQFIKNHPELSDCLQYLSFLNVWDYFLNNLEVKELYPSKEYSIFAEYFGPNSFNGQHQEKDIKEFKVFDILVNHCDFIDPKQFVEDYSEMNIAKVIYQGKYNASLIKNVQENKFNLNEGVVCKSLLNSGQILRVKIKTNSYLDRLGKVKQNEH